MKTFAATLLFATGLSLELDAQQSTREEMCKIVVDQTYGMPAPAGAEANCYTENYLLTGLYGYWEYWNCKPECDAACIAEGNSQFVCDQKAEDAMRAICLSDCRADLFAFDKFTVCGTMCVDWFENINPDDGPKELCPGAKFTDLRTKSFSDCK